MRLKAGAPRRRGGRRGAIVDVRMNTSNSTSERDSISPELAAVRAALKREGRALARLHRSKLAAHWPEQYGHLVRERTARLLPDGRGGFVADAFERVVPEPARRTHGHLRTAEGLRVLRDVEC